MDEVQVTVIVNGHHEGLIASPSLRSVENAVAHCDPKGIRVEILAVLDRADGLTTEIFENWASERRDVRLIHVNFGDLGLSRNVGVSEAQGKWIAFLDADDLWTPHWLAAAYSAGENELRRSVWHPELNLYFGSSSYVYKHIDMDDPQFTVTALAIMNAWTALCFAERELLIEVPYRPVDLSKQLGYEDWGWNIETINAGALHKVVSGTAHGIRTKNASLVMRTTAAYCLPHPSPLFRNILSKRS